MSRKNQKILCVLLIGLNLALIWGNSALPGDESEAVSVWVMKLLRFFPESELFHTILRKAAHFSEFALLGLLVGWMSLLVRDRTFFCLLGLGQAAASIDETIQYFVPGRASMLLDVWIDTAGFATGLAILTVGYTLIKRKKHPEDSK